MSENWLNESGYLVRELTPEELGYVTACSHAGACDNDCEATRIALNFTVPPQLAREYLAPFGAWEREELAEWSEERLADTVLWLWACELAESGEWFGLVH